MYREVNKSYDSTQREFPRQKATNHLCISVAKSVPQTFPVATAHTRNSFVQHSERPAQTPSVVTAKYTNVEDVSAASRLFEPSNNFTTAYNRVTI